MNQYLQILKNHKWAIILAVLIGIIMAIPHIYFIVDNKEVYQGIMMSGLDEEYYLARMQEVRDGHYFMASPFWQEYKDQPNLWPPLSENLAVLTGRFFGLNLINTVLFGNFVFPFLIFLILYALVYSMSKGKSLALFSAMVISLAPNLTDPQSLWRLLSSGQTSDTFLAYSRLISPQIHALFFFSFFLFFWLFLEKRKWLWGILSGIVLGLSFYVYPFIWMFIYVFLGLLILIYFFRKNRFQIKNLFLVMGIGLLIAIPFAWNLIQAMAHPFYKETSLRFGWVQSHSPQLGVTMLILLGFYLLLFPRTLKGRYDFGLAIVLTPFILANQQIITGYLMGPARYHNYYYKPFALIFLIIIFFTIFKRKIVRFSFIAVVLFVSIYNAWMVQTTSYRANEPSAIEYQRYSEVLSWLNINAQKDEVAMGNLFVSGFITTYTSLNSLVNSGNHYSLVSDKELSDRMFIIYYFDGLKPEQAKEVFYEKREDVSKYIYSQRYQKQFGSYDKIPDEKLDDLVVSYSQFYQIPIDQTFKKYNTKYLVWDVSNDLNWQIDNYHFLTEVYQDNNFKIYAFKE